MPTSSTPRAPRDRTPTPAGSTRDRILEIALELFTERGYDATSIRDIAERLGTTKAALYYHFASKADILYELHLRLHDAAAALLDELEALAPGEPRARALPAVLDRLITEVDANRELAALHLRNQGAIGSLGIDERHLAANDDLAARVDRLLDSADLSPADRVRLTCALGAITEGLFNDLFAGAIDHDERLALLRATVADLMRERPV